jgi:hypothetical protein
MKKLNARVGQGFDHSENSLIDNSVPTMSSLQMVEYINADRKAKSEAEGWLSRVKNTGYCNTRIFSRKLRRF